MKLLVILGIATAFFACPALSGDTGYAALTEPSTDDVIDTNAFNATHLFGEPFPIFSYYWTADDFTTSSAVEVEKLTYWIVTSAALPTSVDIIFWDDAAPGPGAELMTYVVSGPDLSFTDTGIQVSGYPVYLLEAVLPEFFFAFGGHTYWTAVQRTTGGDMLAIMDDQVRGAECYRITSSGGPWVAGSSVAGNPPTDMFRIIEGQAAQAFEQNTWGAIKTAF